MVPRGEQAEEQVTPNLTQLNKHKKKGELRKEEERENTPMEAMGLCRGYSPVFTSASSLPPFTKSEVTRRQLTRTLATRKGTTVFPMGEPGPREMNAGSTPVKLLSNVEKLRLLTKAEKAGLLSLAESFGLSLSSMERLGLLSKAEELGVLSAATDTSTPSSLLSLGIALLVLGPAFVFLVPEEYPWEVALQVLVALVCVVGGSASLAASNFVAYLQRSSG